MVLSLRVEEERVKEPLIFHLPFCKFCVDCPTMSKHFTHLHLHTEYSLLDGAIRIKDLIKLAKEQEWKAAGISDHGNIFGAVKFFQEAKKANIKPILGCEMYLTPDIAIKDAKAKYHHILVIVQNKDGYQNLCRLMHLAYQEGFYFKPRIDYRALETYNKGLIISTACLGGHIPSLFRHGEDAEAEKWITWGLDVFGKERFFLELMPSDKNIPELSGSAQCKKQELTNKKLIAAGKKLGVDCIVTEDAHYLYEDDHEAHEVLLSVQTKHLITDPDRMTFGDFRGHIKTTQELLDAFPNQHDAIWRTGEIANRCEFDFETGKLFFPKYPVPEKYTEETFFAHLCKKGLDHLKKTGFIPADQNKHYDARLKEEVNLITNMGYVGYFLIVSDFIRWAKEHHIPVGPGRGSVAGSLVAWALQITSVDPLKYNLLFERFLNPERVSMPDIDIDFCVEKRENVINYVKDKYGHDAVCQIITFGTMMAKGVIKDVARALGFPFQDANNLTNLVPDQLKITLKECLKQEPRFGELMESKPEVKHLMQICFKLEGLTRHASKHAAGVVISPEPLKNVLPLYIPAKTDELVTQYAMTELETLGFLKMDFLGLKNLTIIDRALKAIENNHDIKLDLDKLPLDDVKTFELIAQGKTSCVFQFESSGIKEVLYKLHPSKFEDLIAVNALYRPGPLGSGMVDDFIERRHGRKRTTYQFPELEPVLGETYGVIVYQEQVMKIASVIAGYSLGAADILRRAMGKKKTNVMAEQKKQFIAGAKKRNFDAKKSEELFDLMSYFAGYGFNKSHSTAYALIAYHTAYLKANYATEFMAAVLSFETSDPDKLSFYLQEARDMGIKILPPDINTSNAYFTAIKDEIRFGLKGIKNVGSTAIELIVQERDKKPFRDLFDFCKRIDMRTVNKRIIESLVCAGAFDLAPGYRSQKMEELEKIMQLAHDEKEREKTGQMDLFGIKRMNSETRAYTFSPQPEWSDREKLAKEKEMIGFYLSAHPLTAYKPLLDALPATSYKTLLDTLTNTSLKQEPIVTTIGLLQDYKTIITKRGDKMAFAHFEDLSGSCEVILFPRVFKQTELLLHSFTEFIIIGNLDIGHTQQCKIKANNIIPLEQIFEHKLIEFAELTLPYSINNNEHIEALRPILTGGTLGYSLKFSENNKTVLLKPKTKALLSLKTIQQLHSWGIRVQLRLRRNTSR